MPGKAGMDIPILFPEQAAGNRGYIKRLHSRWAANA